eukprot:TRINITY_DN583_c0_g1_i1.p1 TRINITY_DN583_c0_g1~~TRINITY_DN583_c0_g1_i1.p1  ORF type:complete len:565 (-),score=145.11 TRINITY_DN583_c0_g1_i1:129-1823(-)
MEGPRLTSKVDLHVECRGLLDMDTFSKSDPMCVLFVGQPVRGSLQYTELGRTEIIKDCLNPKWVKGFTVNYYFERQQYLRFSVYDIDNPSDSLEKHDFLGSFDCVMGDIVTAAGKTLTGDLGRPGHKNKGKISIYCEEMAEINDIVMFEARGNKLAKKDLFGKSDPFLVISRSQESGGFIPVHKTEVIKKNLNPQWAKFSVPIVQLCNGDEYRPLLFEVFDWNKSGKHELIGSFSASLTDLFCGEPIFTETSHTLLSMKKKKPSGTLFLSGTRVRVPSFMDYIAGGCEISLLVSIDFTGSNGDPRIPGTLHHIRPGSLNEYESVLSSVGDILIHYDSDKKIPAFGFGGILRESRQGTVDHCFSLKPMGQSPECDGIEELLHAYRWRMGNVGLAGPTLFTPSIRMAMGYASQHVTQESQQYFILLMITDGVITDMRATMDAIVEATQFPLSIVIVGVGMEDFTNMNVLDADTEPLKHSNGTMATRDIVQFVEFSKFRNGDPALLASEVLEEIPAQLVGFMASRGFQPNPPPPAFVEDPIAPEEYHSTMPPEDFSSAPPPPPPNGY